MGAGAQGQLSQVRQGFSAAPHVFPRMPPFPSLPAVGALPGPLGAHRLPFCSLPCPKDFSHPLLVHFLF